MKWSEFFGKRFMESEVPEDLSNANVEQMQKEQQISTHSNVENTELQSKNAQISEASTNQNQSKSEFDALNAKVAELQEANRKLLMRGTLKEEKPQTDEEIIMDLCVNRRKHGNQKSKSDSSTGELFGTSNPNT